MMPRKLLLILTALTATACVSPTTPTARPSIGLDPATKFSDQLAPGTTDALDGHVIQYTYVTGSSYRLKFEDGRMTAREVGSDRTPVVRDYLAREIGPGVYFVHWMAIDRRGHISLVVDIPQALVHGAAVLPNGMQIFDTGDLTESSLSY